MIQDLCNSVRLVPVFCIICYYHGIRPSEGYDKEEEEEISGGGQGKVGAREGHMGPGDSPSAVIAAGSPPWPGDIQAAPAWALL